MGTASTTEAIRLITRTFPSVCSVPSGSFLPSLMELMAAPPMPTSVPRAKVRFMMGKVTARPERASGPTPWPMNTLSMMLYREYTTMPAMEGREYWTRRRQTDAFSNSEMLRDWGVMNPALFSTECKL